MATHPSFSVLVPVNLLFLHSFDNLSQVAVTQAGCIAVKELFTDTGDTEPRRDATRAGMSNLFML